MSRPAIADAGAAPSLAASRALLVRSRLLGRVSAVIFFLAALAVLDALQTLMRHEFNSIDLLPGETVLVSGMLPADATSHTQLTVAVEGAPGLRFTPLETYKGFWMGGHMWRAELSADPGMPPGEAEITVVDLVKPDPPGASMDDRDRAILFGGQQNPALIFSVTVWPSEAERQAADNSLVRRYTGLPAFGAAGLFALLALLFGAGNWMLFSRAEKGLAPHGVFFIHGVKDMRIAARQARNDQKFPVASGFRVAFARAGESMAPGDPVRMLDLNWQEQGRGRVLDSDRFKGYALFPEDGVQPRYGWLVARALND